MKSKIKKIYKKNKKQELEIKRIRTEIEIPTTRRSCCNF
jgi:hypothetical protein